MGGGWASPAKALMTHKVINESKLPGNCCYEEEEESVPLHPALHWAGQG